jgi:hypothetical protein
LIRAQDDQYAIVADAIMAAWPADTVLESDLAKRPLEMLTSPPPAREDRGPGHRQHLRDLDAGVAEEVETSDLALGTTGDVRGDEKTRDERLQRRTGWEDGPRPGILGYRVVRPFERVDCLCAVVELIPNGIFGIVAGDTQQNVREALELPAIEAPGMRLTVAADAEEQLIDEFGIASVVL